MLGKDRPRPTTLKTQSMSRSKDGVSLLLVARMAEESEVMAIVEPRTEGSQSSRIRRWEAAVMAQEEDRCKLRCMDPHISNTTTMIRTTMLQDMDHQPNDIDRRVS